MCRCNEIAIYFFRNESKYFPFVFRYAMRTFCTGALKIDQHLRIMALNDLQMQQQRANSDNQMKRYQMCSSTILMCMCVSVSVCTENKWYFIIPQWNRSAASTAAATATATTMVALQIENSIMRMVSKTVLCVCSIDTLNWKLEENRDVDTKINLADCQAPCKRSGVFVLFSVGRWCQFSLKLSHFALNDFFCSSKIFRFFFMRRVISSFFSFGKYCYFRFSAFQSF